MAIQIPNPGTGNGASGDNEFVLWSKVKDNFSDQTNAASKLVGTATGQVPLSNQVRAAMLTAIDGNSTTSPNDYVDGTSWYVNGTISIEGTPQGFSGSRHVIESRYLGVGKTYQIAHGWDKLDAAHRLLTGGTWSEWQPLGWNKKNYNTTSAAVANAVIDIDGRIIRSTAISYTDINTTKDSNGFIKAASPIVKVFADKVELNGEAVDQDVTYKKNGVGDYTITTVSGLSTDGWYIELPKDMNGNPKVAVTLSEVDGVISLKTYKRIFSMETFTFEPDLDNPLDIPDTRWIDLRLNEIPVEAQEELPTDRG